MWSVLDFRDNAPILAAIEDKVHASMYIRVPTVAFLSSSLLLTLEDKPRGLLPLLNESCKMAKATDQQFVEELDRAAKSAPKLHEPYTTGENAYSR